MSGTYLTYPANNSSGLTGSATGVPYFVAPLDGAPASPNGGYIGSNAFFFQSATATFPGLVNSTSQSFSGVKTFNNGWISLASVSMSANVIAGVKDPAFPQDAATKNYVDTQLAAFQPLEAVVAASALTNYPGVMVGNILTITATGAISVDGITPSANARILLKDQSTQSQNGIYVVTTVGSLGVSPVLTRATDYNTAAAVNSGASIPVLSGTINALTAWIQTATVVTLNTDPLVFTKFSSNPLNVPIVVGTFDTAAANSNGGVIGSSSLFFQAASATNPGLVSSNNQTFAGIKTFTSPVIMSPNGSSSWSLGQLVFDNKNDCLTFYNSTASSSLQIGQENWVLAQNNSGSTIANGRAVYITGSVQGSDLPTIGLAIATTASTSALLGVTTNDIGNGATGIVTQSGKVHGLDTSAYSPGQRVWLSTASAGFFQVTDPTQPFYSVFVGYVLDVGSTTGSLFLSLIRNGITKPFTNPMTTSGDMIISSGSGNAIRLGIGATNQVLLVTGALPVWTTLNVQTQTISSLSLINRVNGYFPSVGIGSVSLSQAFGGNTYPLSFPISQGSTSWVLQSANGQGSLSWVSALTNPMTTSGDIIVGSGSGTATRYGIGSVGHQLFVNISPVPQWAPAYYANNLIVNSAFDWWQAFGQIASVAQNNQTYVPDQFYVSNVLGGGNTTGIITCGTTAGSIDQSIFGCRVQITTAPTGSNNTNGCELWGILDNPTSVGQLFNQTASLSIQGKALGNVNSLGIQVFYNSVSEAKLAGSSSTLTSEVIFNVTSASFILCSVSAFSTTNQNSTAGCIGFRIRINGVSSGNTFDVNNGFVLEQTMLNKGPFCAPYQRKNPNINAELVECMRFFEKSYDPLVSPGTINSGGALGGLYFRQNGLTSQTGNQTRFAVPYKTTKRPLFPGTITFFSPITGAANKIRDVANATDMNLNNNVFINSYFQSSFTVQCVASGTTAQTFCAFAGDWTSDYRI